MLLTQPVADGIHLVGREVGHAAHPHAEAPERWHRRVACQVAVATEDFLYRLAANQESIYLGLFVKKLYRACAVGGKVEFGVCRGMIETAIHAAGDIERYVLVGATVVHALSVLVLQIERMSAEIHFLETFASTAEAFVGAAGKREQANRRLGLVLNKTDGEGIIAWRGEMVVGGQGNLLMGITFWVEADIYGRLRSRLQVAPMVDGSLGRIDECTSETFGSFQQIAVCSIRRGFLRTRSLNWSISEFSEQSE